MPRGFEMSNDISGVWGKVDMKSGNCRARE